MMSHAATREDLPPQKRSREHRAGGAQSREALEVGAETKAGQALDVASRVASTRVDLGKLERAVSRSEKFALWMDKRYLDPILGLVPGVGEIPTAAAGLYIVAEALAAGVPKWKIFRMLMNIAVDAGVGAIPGIGDIFDFFYKSNSKNAAIFRKYLDSVKEDKKGTAA